MKKIILIMIMAFTVVGLFKTNADAAQKGSMAGIVQTSGSNLNVRSKASTSSTIVAKAPNQSYLMVIESSGDFYYTEYQENKFGYVHKDYVQIVSSNTKQVASEGMNLNVRKGPSTDYTITEKIADKDYVVELSRSGSWSKVLFEGNKTGYVHNDYLKSLYAYPAIALNVVRYKQYDSRWASVTIGKYGQTMQQIGCLTTDMAMIESYRTGKTITPLDMRNSSTYTASGDMYWPSNYAFSFSSNYLATSYNLLKQGKPVLIGLKKANGSQHWVTITGYVGSNSLSAANFTINDPGSSSKTRLSQVLAEYPNFYKIAYYL